MSQQYQMDESFLNINDLITNDQSLAVGLWSRYNPQGVTQQLGIVGLMDSNCFHYQSLIGEQSKGLEQIYYDCLYPENKTIQKYIQFITQDGQQHQYILDINPFEYETVWYLFQLYYYPSRNIIEFIIIKKQDILLLKKLDSLLLLENQVKKYVGGSLIVQTSNLESIEAGKKFSYFPGQIYQVITLPHRPSIYELEKGIISLVEFIEFQFEDQCNSVITYQIPDQDIFYLDQKVHVSENVNFDSFVLASWFRITKIHQVDEEFTYQFLKVSKHTKHQQFSNSNLAPFQLFYKISPNNNKIIITTYSYNYPSITLDFTNSANNFMLTEEFEIKNKITLWHSLFVNLQSDQIFIQIKFFEKYQVYEYSKTFPVKQFGIVNLSVQYGNLLNSIQNYLDIQTRNNIFYNCQQQIEEQNCHFSCQDCDGPTNFDCLSCSEVSQRIYIPEHKVCICPYNYLDDQINQNCLSLSGQSFDIQELIKNNDCKFGYFEYDDSCYACPSIFSDKQITCLDCLQNVNGWQEKPYCQTTLYFNSNGNTAITIDDQDDMFIFDGLEPYLCRDCIRQSFFDNDSIFKQFSQLQNRFKQFCEFGEYYFDQEIAESCYACKLSCCIFCTIEVIGMKCVLCEEGCRLIDGVCIADEIYRPYLKGCRIPNYLNSMNVCKLCPIKNCKYCFEYYGNDLEESTLYLNFKIFGFDEYVSIGCAMCDENYSFDFTIGNCIYKQPSLSNCLRSFVNLQGQEICTLSSTDFSVASEIINCSRLIDNCMQCYITPMYVVRCIICNLGFSVSIIQGNCYKNTLVLRYENAKILIEGEEYADASVQRIQSFMMKFLPNQYIHQKNYVDYLIYLFEIECNQGYQLYQSYLCAKYCTQECLDCQESKYLNQFYCAKCPLNYYQQPIRSQLDGSCIRCPELCEICEVRSEDEIQKINPNFQITEDNKSYTYKCIRPISNSNVIIDSYLQIAKYCFTGNCNYEFTKYSSILRDLDAQIDTHYCNQIGVQDLKIQINSKADGGNLSIKTELKKYIFSLQRLKIEVNFFYKSIYFKVISGFDYIEINDVYLDMRYQDFLLHNENQKINLVLNNIVFQEIQFNYRSSLIDSELFGDISLNNISIINSNFNSSSFLKLNQKMSNQIFQISKLTLYKCNFTNSQLFQLWNNEVQILIEQVVIDSTIFYNSSFLTFFQKADGQSKLEVKEIKITSSQFFHSFILNCTNLQKIIINNFNLNKNQIVLSNIIVFNMNLAIFQTEVNNNTFIESQFIKTVDSESKKKIYVQVDNYNAIQNYFTNSSLFYISNENMQYQLTTAQIQFNQGQTNNQYQDISLFNIHCFQLVIDNIYIVDSNKICIFYVLEVFEIFASNIVYQNFNINNKVSSSLNCRDYQNFNYPLLLISGYSIISLKNIKALKIFSIDEQLIEIKSTRKRWNNMPLSLELINLEFIGNLLLQKQATNYFSLLSINSEQNTTIQMENIFFEKNFIHQQTDDLQDSAAALININLNTGYIRINNLYCSQNALTNSSNSFIFLKSEVITLTNYTALNHNIIPLELWDLYYDFQLEDNQHAYDQDQINQIIEQTFKIKSKCGAGLITAVEFSCFNCLFQDIIGLKSSVFEIKTQGNGNIELRNLKINSSYYDLSSIIESSGCITIQSSSSQLNLKIINAEFVNVFNRLATSILTINPSVFQNQILIQDVTIKNCISLKNSIISILFSTQNINSNKVFITNVNINYQEGAWTKYFEKTDITGNSSSLIQLQNCNVVLSKIIFSGLFTCPLIKLINVQYLLISSFLAQDIQTFYSFNLLEIYQDLSVKQTINIQNGKFLRISIFEIINNQIYGNSRINYRLNRCNQVENLQSDVRIYTFDQIIKLMQSTEKASSIIQIQSNSNTTVIQIQNIILQQINCSYCLNGLIFFNIENYKTLKIKEIAFFSNKIKQFGCLKIVASNQINRSSSIQNSKFINNNGSSGVALSSTNISIKIIQCSIINNIASNQGGGIFLDMDTKYLIINKSTIVNNLAFEGGGIYISKILDSNSKNIIQTLLQFNKADFLSNNLVEYPTHLSLFINSQEMQAYESIKNEIKVRILKLKPYKIIEQGVIKYSQYLMIPSDQVIKNYKNFIPQLSNFYNLLSNLQINLKNSRNELLQNSNQFSCLVSQTSAKSNQDYTFSNIKPVSSLQIDEFNHFDLGSVQFHYDPYHDEDQNLQILVNCSQNTSQNHLLYLINSRTYKCQLGEFYIDEGCQICESTFGFYSVTYNATKCSIFDKTKFASISSHSIQLLQGYWRPNIYSDYTDYCFKNIEFCKGGWKVGDDLCSLGHLGGLCEECDYHNKRGEGNFFKNQQDSECYNCSTNTMMPFIFSFIWTIVSILITLKSIEKSNLLFSKLQFKIRYRKILFKLEKDMEGIFIKMLFIYLWIFSVIFTFNIKFSISFSFIDQTSNTSQFMASSLDCFLSEISSIEVIYVRIIATMLLILIQLGIILIGYQLYILASKRRFQTYIISNTLLYLYVSNFSGLIKQFCSIVSKRIISNIQFIQGDVTQPFGSLDHNLWIWEFATPGLVIFGFLIPFSLFLFMFITKNKFNIIQFRRHICYLFDEYNEQNYFWEQIKFSKKICIILIMTYFESNILLKASLLGLLLLIYQILAEMQQPYNLQKLNRLDLQAVKICSIAIFIAIAKYVSEQELQNTSSQILQVFIIFLCIKLCYQFILDIFKAYVKKYQVAFITLLTNFCKMIKPKSKTSIYFGNLLLKWSIREKKMKQNFTILKAHLIKMSSAQKKFQKTFNAINSNQNLAQLIKYKQLKQKKSKIQLSLEK
ncbi:unnamed protein product [Paramecium octaurelia]|uniref:Uncharacterized protein n=1 Tax=Paramecium octaurelia TaxID=43137 RepID=A0A8S1W5Q4_PAROT|nr:unnamed protein product [Paramecium octaurelia]